MSMISVHKHINSKKPIPFILHSSSSIIWPHFPPFLRVMQVGTPVFGMATGGPVCCFARALCLPCQDRPSYFSPLIQVRTSLPRSPSLQACRTSCAMTSVENMLWLSLGFYLIFIKHLSPISRAGAAFFLEIFLPFSCPSSEAQSPHPGNIQKLPKESLSLSSE